MSEDIQEMKRGIFSAVQEQLTGFGQEVATSLKQIADDAAAAAAARTALESQVQALATALETQTKTLNAALEQANAKADHATAQLEQVSGTSSTFQADIQKALEGRLAEYSALSKKRHDEINVRFGKVVDESNAGIAAAVQSAAAPVLKKVEQRQDKLEGNVKHLDGSIRRFDEQAGQMVNHINTVTTAIETRLEKISADVMSDFEDRLASMVIRIDEVSAAAARQQADVTNIVNTRVDSTEQRINERLLGVEHRVNDEMGQRVADIDAHVGRVGAGLDEAVMTLNDRIAHGDARFEAVDNQFAEIREVLGNVDGEAIDEMKDKISSALGQAELVRIEMERYQETVDGKLEENAVRLTEIETTVQDQSMDVETAVQLERLEEVERAVLMLDPDIMDRHDDSFASAITPSADPDDYSADGFPGEMTMPEIEATPAPAPEPTPAPEPDPTPAPAPEPAAAPAPEPAPVAADTGALDIEMPKMPSLSELTGSASTPLSPPSTDAPAPPSGDDATVAMPRPSVNS